MFRMVSGEESMVVWLHVKAAAAAAAQGSDYVVVGATMTMLVYLQSSDAKSVVGGSGGREWGGGRHGAASSLPVHIGVAQKQRRRGVIVECGDRCTAETAVGGAA